MTNRDRLAALAVVVIWGFNFVAVKVGLRDLPPFLFMAIRFALVALVLAPFFRPPASAMRGLLVIGLTLGVGHFGLLFAGLKGLDAASAAIAIQLSVPFSAITAAVYFSDKLGWVRGFGMAMAFAGVALLAGEPHRPDPFSFLLVVIAALAWAVANVQIKKLGQLNPVAVNGWTALFAAPMLLGFSLVFESGQIDAIANAGWQGWSGVVYTVIGASLIAYTLWYRLISRHAMNDVVPFTLLGPIIGIAGGVLLLGEPLTWQKLVGGAITLAGVTLIQFHEKIPQPWKRR